jgi:hypothetical protein
MCVRIRELEYKIRGLIKLASAVNKDTVMAR